VARALSGLELARRFDQFADSTDVLARPQLARAITRAALGM
jgi:hypothetical protein